MTSVFRTIPFLGVAMWITASGFPLTAQQHLSSEHANVIVRGARAAAYAGVTAPPANPEAATVTQRVEPIVRPGGLIAVNTSKDQCFNKGADGKLTKVKCPDVIVAKPTQSNADPKGTLQQVASKARASAFVPRQQIKKLGVEVQLSGGTYNCYTENPPGTFNPTQCPDVIVLEPGK